MKLFHVIIALAFSLLLVAGGGCTTLVVTKNADGSVKGEYYSLFKDVAVDELTVPTQLGPASLKGGKGNVNQAVTDIAAAARSIAGAGVRAASPLPLPEAPE